MTRATLERVSTNKWADEDGKFSDKWFLWQAGEEPHPAADHDSSFSPVPETELFKIYASGKITASTNTGTLLEEIKAMFIALVLLEEVKFFFYYNSCNLEVLAKGVDQINERCPKKEVQVYVCIICKPKVQTVIIMIVRMLIDLGKAMSTLLTMILKNRTLNPRS